MQITKEWLKEKSACKDGYEWSLKVLENKPMDSIKFIRLLMDDDKYHWANWVIVRVFDKPNNVRYAIFAAEQVIDIYEKEYPNDKRPRLAIEAAKKWLEEPNEKNRAAARAAAGAADAASWAAAGAASWAAAGAAAWDAAGAAAGAAAWAAAGAAWAAGDAARDADAAAAAAAAAASWAAGAAANKQMQIKILEYGISLLKD